MTKPFNVGVFATTDSAKVELCDMITGEGTGTHIYVLGMDSDEFIKEAQKLMKQKRNGKINVQVTLKKEARLMASITTGWDDISLPKEVNGVKANDSFPFSIDNAEALYTLYPEIREQVSEFVTDRANFTVK